MLSDKAWQNLTETEQIAYIRKLYGAKQIEVKTRKCLKCDGAFESEGDFNRICTKCSGRDIRSDERFGRRYGQTENKKLVQELEDIEGEEVW